MLSMDIGIGSLWEGAIKTFLKLGMKVGIRKIGWLVVL